MSPPVRSSRRALAPRGPARWAGAAVLLLVAGVALTGCRAPLTRTLAMTAQQPVVAPDGRTLADLGLFGSGTTGQADLVAPVLDPALQPAGDSDPVPTGTAAPPLGDPVFRAAGSVHRLGSFTGRLRADVIVSSTTPLSPATLKSVSALAPQRSAVVRLGTLRLGPGTIKAAAIDPTSFRRFTPPGTAEATAVWASVARGEVVVRHSAAQDLKLGLGHVITIGPGGGGDAVPLRLGALATTNLPGADLLVDETVGGSLGLAPATGVVLSAGTGDPTTLAASLRKILGRDARVDLLTAPAANPVAFLTGGKAAKAFGAFSYRYFADGTIEPDDDWVRANVRTVRMPVIGKVTCHRLMLRQLQGALQQVVNEGLGDQLHSYDGCYVPRFIERNPQRSISLHTWGIAIDLDASTNYRGIQGTMNPRIVEIFKSWGFRWGGDWTYTDPMHFELGALLS